MEKSAVRLITMTPEAEKIMGYCARVSNPNNQDNPRVSNLLKYCVQHGHWSVFEQANMVLEINTSRAIAPQILRHRSFAFQEFSQRYAVANDYVPHHARRQDEVNRQNSWDDLNAQAQTWFAEAQKEIWAMTYAKYQEALALGIAKESARALLPLNTKTRIYMNGTIRSWIHYIQLRTKADTQLEHRQIAAQCKTLFVQELPSLSAALGWT